VNTIHKEVSTSHKLHQLMS